MKRERFSVRQKQHNAPDIEIDVVPGGKRRTYLWLGRDGSFIGVISGARTLEKLARAILAEVEATPAGRRKAKS